MTYRDSSDIPNSVLADRLDALSDAVTKGRDAVAREFTMRVPAEHDRDADLVLSEAADRIRRADLAAERERELVEALERLDSDLESRNYLESSSLRETISAALATHESQHARSGGPRN